MYIASTTRVKLCTVSASGSRNEPTAPNMKMQPLHMLLIRIVHTARVSLHDRMSVILASRFGCTFFKRLFSSRKRSSSTCNAIASTEDATVAAVAAAALIAMAELYGFAVDTSVSAIVAK
jgi:hypothetical protein